MNDSQVTAVSKEEVLADTTDSTANAYLVSVSDNTPDCVEEAIPSWYMPRKDLE
jgi:hypothetical protein